MPLILTFSPSGGGETNGATLTVTARTVALRGAALMVRASTRPEVRGAALRVTAALRTPARGAALTVSATLRGPAVPVQVITGAPLPVTAQTLTGLPGTVTSWAYGMTDTQETLDVTVDGLFGTAQPTVTLTASVTQGGRNPVGLPTRAFRVFGQEPQLDLAAHTTTFRFVNSFAQDLRGVKLPELIPWVENPSPPACPPVRQRKGVSALVVLTFKTYLHPQFALADDPLRDEEWVEGLTNFSTRDLTLQGLWDATYGLLGMVIGLERDGTGIRPVGRWPQPATLTLGPAVVDSMHRVTRTEARELLQTPSRLTVRGADDLTELDAAGLLELVGAGDPAYEEIVKEVAPDGEFIEEDTFIGTARTRHGWRKAAGQVVNDLQVVTDTIRVQETVDGVVRVREFPNVATGFIQTTTTFDPQCPTRPILQVSRTREWAYSLSTVTGNYQTLGPGIYAFLTTGDLTASEDTVTTYTYSPQGHRLTETKRTRVLASLTQQGAEAEVQNRGPLQGREFTATVESTRWIAAGGGKWRRITIPSRQSLLPVYDAESGEAVRTASVTRTLPVPPVITDEAPPSFECGPCGAVYYRDLLDPTGVVLRSGDAGFAEEREVSVPFLKAASLIPVARQLMTQNWHRVVTTDSYHLPFPVTPGTLTADGLVREVRMTGKPGVVESTVTCARIDDLYGGPGVAAVEDWRAARTEGKALMLTGANGGARARVVTGWKVTQGEADVEDAFIRFRTGSPPRPGDELDWRLVNGVREATGAR